MSRSSGRRLRGIFAEIHDDAPRTLGLACLADVTPMQYQPVMRVPLELVRRHAHELIFDGAHVDTGRESGPVRDAKYVRVDGDRRFAERRVQDDVRGLAADAG